MISGEAVRRAEAEFAGQERQRRIKEAFPVAWRQLAEGPDELLVDLVAEAVAGIAGHAPDPEEVARFLAGLSPRGVGAASTDAKATRATAPTRRTQRLAGIFTGTTPTAVTIDGEIFAVGSWRDVLIAVCRFLAEREPNFEERVLPLRGRKRSYFSTTAEELVGPLSVPGTRVFVEGNLSANNIVSLIRSVLRAVRGRDDIFSVAVDDGAPRRRRHRTS